MNKDEYREKVLKELEVIRLNTEMTSIFIVFADAILFLLMVILLIK